MPYETFEITPYPVAYEHDLMSIVDGCNKRRAVRLSCTDSEPKNIDHRDLPGVILNRCCSKWRLSKHNIGSLLCLFPLYMRKRHACRLRRLHRLLSRKIPWKANIKGITQSQASTAVTGLAASEAPSSVYAFFCQVFSGSAHTHTKCQLRH